MSYKIIHVITASKTLEIIGWRWDCVGEMVENMLKNKSRCIALNAVNHYIWQLSIEQDKSETVGCPDFQTGFSIQG